MVGWSLQKRPADASDGRERALSVELWQAIIGGKKPTGLPGASDSNFQIHIAEPGCNVRWDQYSASAARIMHGRLYSGRALDMLRDRRIAPGQIDAVISSRRAASTANGRAFYNETGEGPVTGVGLTKMVKLSGSSESALIPRWMRSGPAMLSRGHRQ